MRPTRFTKKEEVVFYGMVAHPEMNDHELSELLDERISTITSIRRRLKDRGAFGRIRIPVLYHLGCELLIVTSGRFKPRPLTQAFIDRLKALSPAMVYTLCGTHEMMAFGVAKNYTIARSRMDALITRKEYSETIDPRSWSVDYVPFGAMTDIIFFDFEPLVRRAFGIGTDDALYTNVGAPRNQSSKVDMHALEDGARFVNEMSMIERRVFLGLIEYPDMPDKGVADKIKVSRQAISKMRKRFEGMALLKDVVVPNFSILDLGLFVFLNHSLGPGISEKERAVFIKKLKNLVPYSGFFATKDSIYGITQLNSFETFETTVKAINSHIEEHDLPITTPMAMPFSTKDLYYVGGFDLLPIARELMGMNDGTKDG